MARVEADGLGRDGQGQGDGVVGLDEAGLAGGDRDAGLAPAVDGVDRGGPGGRADGDAKVDVTQVADRAGELELGGFLPQGPGVVEELGAGRVAARAAVVVGRVPAGQQPDEKDRVDGLGGLGVAEPDPLAALFPAIAGGLPDAASLTWTARAAPA